ncbi:MAG: hypothetical protein ACFFCW_27375 [Candidatus Hodarchaeota archaeon]
MENISGYARLLARTRVEQQINKTLLCKPYLKYGQCYVLWSYFFQLGGILGAKHSANLDAFGHAFLGMQGDAGAVKSLFNEVANELVMCSVSDSMTFSDYVGANFMGRIGYTEDAYSFFFKHGMEKITPETAEELAWQYALDGAALGAIYPDVLREMFQRTHAEVPKGIWERARASGLDIPPEQDLMSYEEFEEDEDEVFMAYCRECCPNLYSIFIA